MEIIFIRHGKTAGNLKKRYIGKIDEPLCEKGIEEILKNSYPSTGIIVTSGMKRCIETASLIFPDKDIVVDRRLNECNFGEFENKNYIELKGNENYQKWLDSNGTIPFPKGEAMEEFKKRCIEGFLDILDEEKGKIAFVVHGGTIMAILERFNNINKSYYDFMCENGNGFICSWEGGKCKNIRSLL